MENSRLDQFLQHKSLCFKFDDSSRLMDAIIEGDKENKLPLKNVCAKLHVELVEKLDKTIGVLNISKREFIEYAIIEAIQRAEQIMDEVDITEFLREQKERAEK